MIRNNAWRRLAVAAVAVLLMAGVASAQVSTGNLYGTVQDEQGNALPGATVRLSGLGAPRAQVSDANGHFRYLNLDPGNYALRAELEGFSPVEVPRVNIRVAVNTTLEVQMSAAVEEVITVTSESPLLDERITRTGTSVTEVELEKIPTSRDPWAILTQTPGVAADRINVGGNESGQQAVFTKPGASDDENSFSVDGVVITDMAAIGASPTYYDFDAFEEIQVTTGGTDVSVATGGVQLNMVTKRGTNEWKGSARYYLTDGDWQSDPDISSSDAGPGQNLATFRPNRIEEIDESGGELGFPIWKDHFWGWVYKSENDIKNLVAGGTRDRTILRNEGAKLNAQFGSANSAVASYNEGDKLKFGRNAGPTRPPETTWNQTGPVELIKFEDTHVFGSNFFLTGLYSFVDGGFALSPSGGLNADWFQTDDGVYHGSFLDFSSNRDVTQYRLDGSVFFNTGSTAHELKFGGSYREAETLSVTAYPKGRLAYGCRIFGCDPVVANRPYGANTKGALLFRNGAAGFTTEYSSTWVQDTFTMGRMTANAGLRYDLQEGVNDASAAPANSFGGRTFFPALAFPGNDGGGFEWESISPRLGLTWAMGEEGKTFLRASYARYVQQLAQGSIARVNPVSPLFSLGYFNDANGNNILDDAEAASYDEFFSTFNPANPFSDVDRTDPNLDPGVSDSVSFSLEHAFLPEFVGSASVSYGIGSDIPETQRLVREAGVVRVVRPSDWVPGDLVTPEGVRIQRLRDGVANAGGFFLTNGDRETESFIVTLAATKRLSNRWSMRGNLSWNDTSLDVPGSYVLLTDPNPTLVSGIAAGDGGIGNGNVDGGIIVVQSGGSGSKGNIWLNSEWSANLNGLYQVAPDRPWGFNLGANLTAREGYPNPEFRSISGGAAGDGIGRSIRLAEVGDVRNDDIYTLDFHIDKEFRFNVMGLTLSADVFNVFNDNTVLQRQRSRTSAQYRFITETLSPRAARLGVRLTLN